MTSGRSSLDRCLAPESIAVIGASDRPGSLGLRTMHNLEHFTGRIYPVSRRLEKIGRHRCYAAVEDLPEAPDCVVLAVPAAAAENELAACARRGTGGCVVFASGFAEIGTEDGAAAQARLARIARQGGMRLLGPNTTGFANFGSGAHAGFAEFPGGVAGDGTGVGLVSQSGALGLALAQAAMHGTAISHVLTCGNSADLDVADLVGFLREQPAAGAIALTFEGIAAPERLFDAIRAVVSGGKPVAVCRLGRTPAGATAVRWHTGTDPHSGLDWDRQLASVGATIVRRPETLIETAAFLRKTHDLPRPTSSPRVAILSSSGGTGILAADTVEAAGLPLARFGPATTDRLSNELPGFGSPRNPCDATAQASSNPGMLTRSAEAILADPDVDCLILPWGKAWDSGQFDGLSRISETHGKPVCLVWMSQWLEGPGAEAAEGTSRLSVFRSMDNCVAALANRR